MAKSPHYDNEAMPGKPTISRPREKPGGGVSFKKDTRKATVIEGSVPGVMAASGMGLMSLANPATAVGLGAALAVRGAMGVLDDAAKPGRERKARAATSKMRQGRSKNQTIGPTKSGGFR